MTTSGLTNNRLTHENIEKAIHLAFDHAYTLLSALDVQIALKNDNKTTLHQVSLFLRSQFKRKTINFTSDDSQYDLSEDESIDRSKSADDSPSESSEENSIREDISPYDGNKKSNFHGMRVFDNIPTALSNSYFTIAIDGRRKYVHKKTACWLLTDSHEFNSRTTEQREYASKNLPVIPMFSLSDFFIFSVFPLCSNKIRQT